MPGDDRARHPFHLERTLGVELSHDTISKITDGISAAATVSTGHATVIWTNCCTAPVYDKRDSQLRDPQQQRCGCRDHTNLSLASSTATHTVWAPVVWNEHKPAEATAVNYLS